jgi:hypothetical protein
MALEPEFIDVSWRLKRYLFTECCILVIHKQAGCLSRTASSCACV